MKLEDMTPEWAKQLYRDNNMRPMSGDFFSPDFSCGCLVGVMAVSKFDTQTDSWTLFDICREYDIDAEKVFFSQIIRGFDDGWDGVADKNRCESYDTGYRIGKALANEDW